MFSCSLSPSHSHIIQQGSCGQKPVLNTDLYALSIIFPVDAQAGAVVGVQIVLCRSTFINAKLNFHQQINVNTDCVKQKIKQIALNLM